MVTLMLSLKETVEWVLQS